VGTATRALDPRIAFQFGALFHHGGQHVIADGVALILKIRKGRAAQWLRFVGGNQAVDGGLRHLQKSFTSGLAGGQCGHAGAALLQSDYPPFPYRLFSFPP
jgi:hypothetical protein